MMKTKLKWIVLLVLVVLVLVYCSFYTADSFKIAMASIDKCGFKYKKILINPFVSSFEWRGFKGRAQYGLVLVGSGDRVIVGLVFHDGYWDVKYIRINGEEASLTRCGVMK